MESLLFPRSHYPGISIIKYYYSYEKTVGMSPFYFMKTNCMFTGYWRGRGCSESFKDFVYPYIKGMAKSKEDIEVFASLYTGCKKN